ncbi:doubled motif LPXTG anchor domain-containing protein [Hungatella effluvii]|uniref:doubled motif LPXTG anchor domain-containing protein n=1 Tax=Hungatella effluvii TaxID=1096246 RepID=UPI002A8096AE|nr:doubled motif LPXTG anchor domain-containing protein [Hungatella effluvii]
MKGLKKKLRRGLAGFLSFVLTMTSFNMVSWADVAAAFEKENATFVMSGEDLRDSAQAAIDNGDEFNFEDLGVDTSDRSLAKEYQRLFETGSVFEFAPAYDMDEEEYADGAELRMFIRINGDPEGYQITGDEDIIFLYINDSDARVTFRSRIDGYTTQKVTVKGNSTLLDAEAPTAPVGGEGNGNGAGNGAGGAGVNGGAGSEVQNPDGNAGGGDGAVDGTVQNPDGDANMGEAADGNGTTNGDVQNPDGNAGGAIDGEGAANGDVQNPDAGLDGENGNAANDVQNPDANVSDGNGTNDGTVQNPDANADGENTDHSNTNTGKEEQVQKPEDHTGTNGGVQNSDTNKTEDGGKAEAGNSESGSSNSGAASDGGASNSGASDGGASNSGASNNGASDSGSSNSGASDSGSSDSGSDQGDSLVSAATLNRHYTHILTTAVNGDAGSKESDKVSSDEGKEDKVDAADKTDKADNTDTSDKHDSEDVNSDTNTEDGSNGSNGGNADKDAVVTPDGEEGNSAVEDNKADAVTPDNGENQDPSDDKADDQGEVSKPDDGQGDAVIDDNSDKDNADKDNADKNAAEDNKADDTTVDGKDHAANGEDGKKNDSLVVDPEADEKEEVSKTGTTSGKTYGQVVLDESYYAKAYVTTLNKLHIDVSKEGYAVTYTVTPVGTAAVKGAKNVEEGKDLTFTVKPQVGYVIDHVTANGESLEAVEDDEATASNADTGVKRFVVPEIEEEQEIVVVMAEIGEHPEFNFSKTLGDVVVSLHAEEGILPAGTVAKVTEVTEKVEEAVKEKTAKETGEDTSANTVLAYDIKLFVENEAGELEALDNSWSENGYVEVTFAGKAIEEKSAEAEKVEITHIDTGDVDVTSENVEIVRVEEVREIESVAETVNVTGGDSVNAISFDAEHFSIYALCFSNGLVATIIRTMSTDGKSIGTKNYYEDWRSKYTISNSSRLTSDIAANIMNNESDAFKSYRFVKATIGNHYEDGDSVLRVRQQRDSSWEYKLEYSLEKSGNNNWKRYNGTEDLYFWFEPITITVTFDPNEDYGGTGEPFTVIVGDEGKIITPDNPFTNKKGYEFVGWHGEKSGHHSGTEMLQQTFIEGVQYPPNIDNKTNTITSDITLYATWLNKKGTDGQEAKFFIRTDGKAPFEPNGYGASDYYPSTTQTQLTGTLRNKIEINNNPEMVAANILIEPFGTDIAAAAKKAGKSFNPDTQKVLWYVIKDQGDWHVDGIVVDKNTYSVRYWPNGGNENVPPTQNYSEGTTVRVNYNNIPTRIGYEFLGWDTDKASTSPRYVSNGTNNSFVIKDANVDLYAIWKPKDGIPFTVEHYTQQLDKSYPQKATVVATKYSTTGTIVKDDDYKKTMPGFTYVSGIVDNITEAEVQGDGSTVLKLYYTRNTDTPYTIEHYQQSVENPEEYKLVETDTETGSGVTGEKAAFTPKDYTNDGFEYNAALTMPEDRTITGDGKLVVKLYYDRKSYSVKYEYTGNVPDGVSSLPQTKTYRVGEDVTIAADAAAKGYSFSGWKINGKDAEMFKMPAHDIKITGSFGVNSYTVTYKVDNSTYGAVETYQYGENVSLREKPVKEGYSFKGWSRDSGFTMPAENVVIEGHFEINKYTVRYEVDGALYGEEESYDFGEMVEIREEPTKDGYTFSHWSQKEAFTMPANDVVIKGNFSINSYKVTYKVDGVQYGDTETHEYGSAVTLRAEPETEGYTFSGWNRENNFTMPAEDVVIEGNFKINSYTVTYKVDGEISGEAETYKYGAVVTLREEPAKEGYTFSHWSRESGFTMPAENIVVEGHFKINSYTVTYKVDDQLYGKVDTYKFGEDVTLRDAPTKEGYTFSGWSETSGFKMPAKDVEIRGNFSINDYTVTYKVDGKVIDEKKHQYNEEVTVRADETKEGYTFSGWSSEDVRQSFIQRLLSSSIAGKTFRMPAKDVVIEGHFDINSYKVTYQVDGVQSGETETYEYGTLVTIRDDLEKEGHKFSGWNLKEDFAMPAEDVVIVGSFTANEYTVTYLVDGTPYETAETYLYGTAVKLKEAPEKEGYTFSGWDHEEDFTMPAENVVINGSFSINSYKVTYEVDGNAYGKEETYEYGSAVTLQKEPEKEGYTFSKWDHEDGFAMPAHDVVIKGSFKINSYKVTYKVDGEQVGEAETYEFNAPVTLREAPEKEGYTFSGWSRDTGFNMPAKDVVIEGSFTINNYTVTYLVDGKQTGETETYQYNQEVTVKADAEREGYTFSGWSSEDVKENFIQKLLSNSIAGRTFHMPAKNVEIEGSFDINSYKVTYKVDGKPVGEVETYNYGTLVTVRQSPEKEGYTFSGWSRTEAFEMPAEDVVIEGSYKINSYTVTYKVDGEQYGEKETYEYGAAVTLREKPSREGYTFKGWSYENGFKMPAEDVVIEGSYEINSYTVTYKVDGQQYGEPEVYKYNELVRLKSEPTKEGYTFSHWNYGEDFRMPAKDVVIEGNFGINSYTVTYKIDGVQYGSTETYEYGSAVTLREEPEREGYTFNGWNRKGNFTMPAGDIVIEGSFKINSYTVTYKVDGEISGETESYEYGADVSLREEPVKEGYTFSHWSRTTGFTMPAENVVIEGSFKINSYTVTYIVDGEITGEVESYEYGTEVKLRSEPSKEGHEFGGWNRTEDFTMPAENVVIEGNFDVNEYTVTYLVDGKDYGEKETYKYGTSVTLRKDPEKEGHTFSGWNQTDGFVMPAKNVVIEGSFSINSYTVVYKVDGEVVGDTESYEFGAPVSLRTEPQKEGYTFSGWDRESGFNMPAENVEIEGHYSINSYTVTYKVDGELYGDIETYEYNAPVELRQEPQKEGYTFGGWSSETGFNMPAENVVIEGSFKVNEYTVTYFVDDKFYDSIETYSYGSQVKLKEAPQKEGYTFSGWDHDDRFTMPAEDVVVKGSFNINSYKVTYEVDGTPYGMVEIYKYGDLVTLQKNPTKEGYTFSGWDHSNEFAMPARDVKIKGSFIVNSYTVTYKVDGAQIGEPETYKYGEAVTLREKPSKEGYTFNGWSYEAGFNMPAEDVVIEGSYQINSYTVTYKVDGEQFGEQETYEFNGLVQLRSEPTKEGYTFSHWNRSSEFNMPANDVVIEGNFKINSYTVTYKVDGSQYGSTETYEYGSAVVLREEPKKEGYTFSGWDHEDNFMMPADDVVIEGTYKINSYTVTYKVDGEVSGEVETYEYGAEVTLRGEPVKEGYTFSHWSQDTGFTMPAKNMVIEGNFLINSYTVTYKVDGEIFGEVETYNYGTVVNLRSEPTKEGHKFGGWNRTEDFTMPAENVIIEGNFDVNEYTVTYLVDGKDYGEKETYKYGTPVILRDNPEKEGYTFSGWNPATGFIMPARNVVIEGSYKINSYTVTYKVDGEQYGEPETHAYGELVQLKSEPIKEGYTFSHWNQNAEFTMPAKDVVIEGNFSINSYTVTYKVDGTQYGENETYEYGSTVTLREEPKMEGYTFSGWSQTTEFKMPAEDVVIEGSYKINSYTVTYKVDGEPYGETESHEYGELVQLKSEPTKEGYTFSHWNQNAEFKMPAKDVVIEGSFSINSYTVTYKVDGSQYGEIETYEYGSPVTMREVPKEKGYTFSGWDREEDFAMPAENVVIKGTFSVNSYTVTYKVDGEVSGAVETYEYGREVTLREEPLKEGYTFSHWNQETGFTMPAENVVIEGSFHVNSYTVTYKVDGEITGEVETYEYGTAVKLRSEPIKEGHKFGGWNRTEDFIMPAENVVIEGNFDVNEYIVTYLVDGKDYGEKEMYKYGTPVTLRKEPEKDGHTFSGWNQTDGFTMPARNVVIEGSFNVNNYTVVYKIDGEVVGDTESYEFGAPVSLRSEPRKEGYTFSGWNRESGFNMPAENVVIEGRYSINSYTVTYKVDGELYGSVETYEYNSPVTVKVDPTKSGYTFSGWDKTGTFRMPAQDIEITGTFSRNSNNNGGNGGGSTPDNNKPYVPNGPGTDDGPTVTIDPDAVPLANAPVDGNPTDNLILIDDGNVPLAGLPKTGDRAGAQAGLAAILSGFLLAAFTMLNNKKKEENK